MTRGHKEEQDYGVKWYRKGRQRNQTDYLVLCKAHCMQPLITRSSTRRSITLLENLNLPSLEKYDNDNSLARKVPCLEYLTSPELDVLSHKMGLRRVKPGEVIYQPGDPGNRLYVVHKGTVVESSKSAEDGKVEEEILVAGSFFGEEALLTPEPRSHTVSGGSAYSPSG